MHAAKKKKRKKKLKAEMRRADSVVESQESLALVTVFKLTFNKYSH